MMMMRMSLIQLRGIKAGLGLLFLMSSIMVIIIFLACSSSTDAARILAMPPAPSSIMQVTRTSCRQQNHSEAVASRDHTYSSILLLDNKGVCTLCEQFTSQAIYYVTQNKTESEIIDTLHQACSLLQSSFLQQQCMTMVDQHISLFFQEIATIKPSEFCRQLNLCDNQLLAAAATDDDDQTDDDNMNNNDQTDNKIDHHLIDDSSQLGLAYQDFCTLCHCAMATLLAKLKDPTSQIIQVLILKGCAVIEKYVGGCEELLLKYGPLLLSGLGNLLETFTCNSIHVCSMF